MASISAAEGEHWSSTCKTNAPAEPSKRAIRQKVLDDLA